jgi:hypothetical protein
MAHESSCAVFDPGRHACDCGEIMRITRTEYLDLLAQLSALQSDSKDAEIASLKKRLNYADGLVELMGAEIIKYTPHNKKEAQQILDQHLLHIRSEDTTAMDKAMQALPHQHRSRHESRNY